MSERTSAYTSECQISPKISRTLAYAGPIRYSVTGPLRAYIAYYGRIYHNYYLKKSLTMAPPPQKKKKLHTLLKFAIVNVKICPEKADICKCER